MWANKEFCFGGKGMSGIPDWVAKMAVSRDFAITVRIGRSGVADNLIKELDEQLKSKQIVKVKLNRGLTEKSGKQEIWDHICSELSATLVLSRGNVAVFFRA
jgi:RNA-binding protein YhbY